MTCAGATTDWRETEDVVSEVELYLEINACRERVFELKVMGLTPAFENQKEVVYSQQQYRLTASGKPERYCYEFSYPRSSFLSTRREAGEVISEMLMVSEFDKSLSRYRSAMPGHAMQLVYE